MTGFYRNTNELRWTMKEVYEESEDCPDVSISWGLDKVLQQKWINEQNPSDYKWLDVPLMKTI